MPTQCLWQPDIRSSYTSKYRLECPALCTFDDLTHNPKREIIRTIGSRFLRAAPCSQPLDPFAFISTRGIFHLPFYDLFSHSRLGLGSRAARYRYNENNQSRAVINHPVIRSIKTNSY